MIRFFLVCTLLGSALCFSAIYFSACDSEDGGSCEGALDYPARDSCQRCLVNFCNDEAKSCYGGSWSKNKYSGTCATYTKCLCGCSTFDATCAVTCATSRSHDCFTCESDFVKCRDTAPCDDVCSRSYPNDAGQRD